MHMLQSICAQSWLALRQSGCSWNPSQAEVGLTNMLADEGCSASIRWLAYNTNDDWSWPWNERCWCGGWDCPNDHFLPRSICYGMLLWQRVARLLEAPAAAEKAAFLEWATRPLKPGEEWGPVPKSPQCVALGKAKNHIACYRYELSICS